MVVMGSIFGALASSSPRPKRMLQQVMMGFLLAVPLCFVTVFYLMIQARDYPTLVLATMPLMAFSAWLISSPKRAGVGVGMALFSSIFLAPTNAMTFDAANYFNVAFAQVMGVAIAYVAFLVLLPEHTMGNRKHVAAALWQEALRACTARLPGSTQQPAVNTQAARDLRHRFDNRVRDLLSQLNAAAGPKPNAETRAVVRDGLTLLELGHATIELRAVLATSPSRVVREALQRVLTALAAHLRAPDDATGATVRAAVLEASPLVRAAVPDAAAERLPRLHTALTNLHAIYTSMLDQATANARYR
jgi:uncharacterized membrane protein YccC